MHLRPRMKRLKLRELEALIRAWCLAHNDYTDDIEALGSSCIGGGYPTAAHRRRLYRAGRDLFFALDINPHRYSMFAFNVHCEEKDDE